jgi:hypothetical protein
MYHPARQILYHDRKLTICALQERPCTRCIKRNIGHLCHDEPREPAKKSKADANVSPLDVNVPKMETDMDMGGLMTSRSNGGLTLRVPQNHIASTADLVAPIPVHSPHPSMLNTNSNNMASE